MAPLTIFEKMSTKDKAAENRIKRNRINKIECDHLYSAILSLVQIKALHNRLSFNA